MHAGTLFVFKDLELAIYAMLGDQTYLQGIANSHQEDLIILQCIGRFCIAHAKKFSQCELYGAWVVLAKDPPAQTFSSTPSS
ncbi:hypothetical protein TNCT_643551 [Trichonephila clavata]|uniref:Uncharacterized protein n=1 Tax=Trichonephila clavata TaxID=2740835 RepID=A0A8X6GVG5_TRICU|nr:hypothetical protein TNCT_643551 [Trichonephila clavata]